MFCSIASNSKKSVSAAEERVLSGSSEDIFRDLEFLASRYSERGDWTRAHAVADQMMALAEGNYDAVLCLTPSNRDSPGVNRRTNFLKSFARLRQVIVLLAVVSFVIASSIIFCSVKDTKQFLDFQCAVAPFNPTAFLARAYFERNAGDYEAAFLDCDRAIKVDAHYAAAFHLKAEILTLQGELSDAETFNEQSDKTQSDYWMLKAGIEYLRGNYVNAAADAHHAALIEKTYMAFAFERYYWTCAGDYERALSVSQVAQSYTSNDSERAYAFRRSATCLLHLDRLSEAMVSCDKAIGLEPSCLAFGVKAEILFKQNCYADAVKASTKALFYNEAFAKAYEIRAMSFVHLGKKIEAADDFRRAALLGHQPKDWL